MSVLVHVVYCHCDASLITFLLNLLTFKGKRIHFFQQKQKHRKFNLKWSFNFQWERERQKERNGKYNLHAYCEMHVNIRIFTYQIHIIYFFILLTQCLPFIRTVMYRFFVTHPALWWSCSSRGTALSLVPFPAVLAHFYPTPSYTYYKNSSHELDCSP